MKYTVSIDIDLPRDQVIALFDNPDNMPKWQKGLQSFEPLSGTPGQPGARSRLKYKMGKREIEMTESITTRDLPESFNGTYETKGIYNVVRNRFEELGENSTRWISENEFQFAGIMKFFGIVMKGAFPKQSLKYIQDFKALAEHGVDVRDSAGG